MILLLQNSQEYNNDLRAMIMAFYPGVKIVEKQEEGQEYEIVFKADFRENRTVIEIYDDTEFSKLFGDVSEQSIQGISAEIEGDYHDKQTFRNDLKMASYQLLCMKTGRTLPWGDLTGVRPTKIAMSQLRAGKSYEEAVENYLDVYDVSPRKAELASKVAKNEMEITADIDLDNDYCLYVGIPFCPSRCLYCSFTSYPIALYKDKAVKYIEKLKQELAYVADAYKDKRLVAIYIGGGTPTAISHELLEELLDTIDRVYGLGKYCDAVNTLFTDDDKHDVTYYKNRVCLKEYTIEAGRPDSITVEKLRVMKNHGVTRISINPQTMNNETLKTIGRAHTSAQAKEAFLMARAEGFDNINMDLIAGLPGENLDSMRYTLDEIKKLSPESITVHSLAIKRAANLKQQMSEYGESIHQDVDGMLDMVSDVAAELGMEPYYLYRQKNIGGNLENVGYSKKGLECLYNILIMEEMTDIIAVGAGASTKLTYHSENRVERVENCKSVDDYIDRFDEMIERKKARL